MDADQPASRLGDAPEIAPKRLTTSSPPASHGARPPCRSASDRIVDSDRPKAADTITRQIVRPSAIAAPKWVEADVWRNLAAAGALRAA